MEFRFQRFDQKQYNQVFHTPSLLSASSYHIFHSQVPEVLQRPMDIRESIYRDLERERIRSEIIANEYERQRFSEAEARREMVFQSRGYPQEIMYREHFAPENRRVVMSSAFPWERDGGRYVGEQRPPSPKVKEVITWQPPKDSKNEIIGLGNPFASGGSKRKHSASPAGSGSTGLCSNNSKKKIKEEFSCAACEITATCERGLNEHIAGKKHQAKMEELISNKKGAHIGLGKVMNTVNKQPLDIKNSSESVSIGSKEDDYKTEGCDKTIMTKKKFRFWCHLCNIGVDDENIMKSHKKGKKHLKNRRRKEREKTKRALSRRN